MRSSRLLLPMLVFFAFAVAGVTPAGAVVASINVVAAFGVWMPTPEQLAAINTALAAIFALLVRATVNHKHGTPVQLPRARSRRARKPTST